MKQIQIQDRKTFSELFPDVNYFIVQWKASPFYITELTDDNLNYIYYHLFTHYYNHKYIFRDDIGSVYNTFHLIRSYAPNLFQRLDLLDQIKKMSLEEVQAGGLTVQSQGANPKVKHAMDEMIEFVDTQQVTNSKLSKINAIMFKYQNIVDGLGDQFIFRFKDIFTKIFLPGQTGELFYNETR